MHSNFGPVMEEEEGSLCGACVAGEDRSVRASWRPSSWSHSNDVVGPVSHHFL